MSPLEDEDRAIEAFTFLHRHNFIQSFGEVFGELDGIAMLESFVITDATLLRCFQVIMHVNNNDDENASPPEGDDEEQDKEVEPGNDPDKGNQVNGGQGNANQDNGGDDPGEDEQDGDPHNNQSKDKPDLSPSCHLHDSTHHSGNDTGAGQNMDELEAQDLPSSKDIKQA